MKNIYTKTFLIILTLVIQLYLPTRLDAQCLCGAGIPAQSITQTITIPPTTISSLNFNFQQFDPTVGNLSCVSFTDTVTAINYTGARNTGPDSTAFLFLLSLTSKISGPGILISHPFTKQFGYDTLAKYGAAGDSITYGPTNIITNPTGKDSTGGNAAYLGIGTVPITFSVNGGMITQDGGSNYTSTTATTMGGTMKLVYYYCPVSLLAGGLQNFSAYRNQNNVVLTWDAQNAAIISQFDIEYSINGTDFISIGTMSVDHNTASSNYRYDYNLSHPGSETVYFRIKQTGINNTAGYSAIQKIQLSGKATTGLAIRPNPAVTGISISFDHVLNGDYSIDLVNTAGQVLISKKMKLINNNTVALNWNNKPAPGIYFTRITNTGSREQQIARVVIQ